MYLTEIYDCISLPIYTPFGNLTYLKMWICMNADTYVAFYVLYEAGHHFLLEKSQNIGKIQNEMWGCKEKRSTVFEILGIVCFHLCNFSRCCPSRLTTITSGFIQQKGKSKICEFSWTILVYTQKINFLYKWTSKSYNF